MDKLVDYVRKNIARYNEKALRDHLLQAGYPMAEVDEAFKEAAKPHGHIWVYALIVVAGLILLAGGVSLIFYDVPAPPQVETPQPTLPQELEPCTEIECAAEAFQRCEPMAGSYSLFFGSVEAHYEILGEKEGRCEVRSWFTKNPQEEYLGKEMICLYDPAMPVEEAVQDMAQCEGELAEAILA